MVVNFHQGRGNNRFRVPNFGGVEADLSMLFNEVLVRGGAAVITEQRQWKDVVRPPHILTCRTCDGALSCCYVGLRLQVCIGSFFMLVQPSGVERTSLMLHQPYYMPRKVAVCAPLAVP
ncbi:MAG: hypothetical protein HC767_08180 [Akkermansiaceae bacterium]|nr:hypothetical protein [Akkermansiaceae bacterium]